jgi:CubicO group peptidase (beta-lactamase class C family)
MSSSGWSFERVTGKPLEQVLRERIFGAIGIASHVP